MSADVRRALEVCRQAEKEQALFYRRLAAAAEESDQPELAERFHELHADEQHHLSRLTARLVELGHGPEELSGIEVPETSLAAWEAATRRRELDEVRRYEILLEQDLDETTRALAGEILDVERAHAEQLGGKWTRA